jgi:hypothetical protein
MPCNSGMDSASYDSSAHSEIRKVKDELDNVTRLLCGIMRVISETNPPVAEQLLGDNNLHQWWQRHQAHDRREGR